MGFEDSINITYGNLDYIFPILDTDGVKGKQIMPCLVILSQKSENDIANIIKKPHNFVRKSKNYLKKPQITLRNYIQISQRKGKKKGSWACGCFLPIGIISYTLQNYSKFKSNFSFNNGSIFEIHDYFKARGNDRFNDLSQLINTLSKQDFAGLDNFNKLENLFCTQGVARKLN